MGAGAAGATSIGARRMAHRIPAAATSTPATLASCPTRNEPIQKLSSRTASMQNRPTE